MVSISADVGLTNKFSLAASIPFIINRSVNRSLDATESEFGDLSVLLRAFYSPRILSKPTNLQFALGATIPVGGGVTNVITDERNFASGTVDPLASAIFALELKPGWNVTGKLFTRQVFAEDANGQKTGNYYEYSVQFSYAPLLKGYSTYLGMSAINRRQDKSDGVPFPNSGGNWLNLILGGTKTLIGEGESAIKFCGEFQLPVYKFVNGFQLTEKWNLRAGIGTGFSLFGGHGIDAGEKDFHLPSQPK